MEKPKGNSYTINFSKNTSEKLRMLKGKRMLENADKQDIKDLIPEIIDDNIDKYLESVCSKNQPV